MLRSQAGRLLRKVFVLTVLLACLVVLNIDNGVRKVAAQTTCCQNCQNFLTQCMNLCETQNCPQQCFIKFNYCRSQCSPPCS